MISFIKGHIEMIKDNNIIIENNGIGYKVYASNKVCQQINKNNAKIYTYMNVKEDDISLFGFLSIEELTTFETLITISGVGPKSAISLLDAMNPKGIISSIITGDIQALCTGQGIGKKTAQRIILELKDKVDVKDVIEGSNSVAIENSSSEVVEALMSLGFSSQEILNAISSIDNKDISVNDMIGLCLKRLNK